MSYLQVQINMYIIYIYISIIIYLSTLSMPHYPRQKIRRDDSGTRPGQPGQAGELNSGCGGGQRVVGRNCASDVLMVGSACKPTKMLKKKRAKKTSIVGHVLEIMLQV